jgi:hypothetical protein
LQERIAGTYLLSSLFLVDNLHTTAESAGSKDPAHYLPTVEQMIENDYPVPSYLADVFEKPDGWIETPQAVTNVDSGAQTVYAIDREMVRILYRIPNPRY